MEILFSMSILKYIIKRYEEMGRCDMTVSLSHDDWQVAYAEAVSDQFENGGAEVTANKNYFKIKGLDIVFFEDKDEEDISLIGCRESVV